RRRYHAARVRRGSALTLHARARAQRSRLLAQGRALHGPVPAQRWLGIGDGSEANERADGVMDRQAGYAWARQRIGLQPIAPQERTDHQAQLQLGERLTEADAHAPAEAEQLGWTRPQRPAWRRPAIGIEGVRVIERRRITVAEIWRVKDQRLLRNRVAEKLEVALGHAREEERARVQALDLEQKALQLGRSRSDLELRQVV